MCVFPYPISIQVPAVLWLLRPSDDRPNVPYALQPSLHLPSPLCHRSAPWKCYQAYMFKRHPHHQQHEHWASCSTWTTLITTRSVRPGRSSGLARQQADALQRWSALHRLQVGVVITDKVNKKFFKLHLFYTWKAFEVNFWTQHKIENKNGMKYHH